MQYTIIIPVYNGEDTLYKCLKAATSQSGAILNKDYSVIVVDDGSTDTTAELARKFPVKIISFSENKGRIVARREGAMNAPTQRLLFIDSRVVIPQDTVERLCAFNEFPAVMGNYQAELLKYRSVYDTIFYLIRRKFYGKRNFPQQDELLLIGKENFKRAPKGTTFLLIDKDLFLDLIPERIDKSVNDDTLLFYNLVFKKNIPLARAKNLLFEYYQRTELNTFIPWLFERGLRFADFYLRPGGYFFKLFLFLLAVFFALVLTGITAIFFFPRMCPYYFFGLALLFFIPAMYLAESLKDFVIVSFMLPFVMVIFGAGVLKFIVMKFCSIL